MPAPGALAIWWLGQSGFVIKSRLGTLVIDPYLSDTLTLKYAQTDRPHERMTAIPIAPSELTGVDLVLASHKHTDHMDPGTLVPLMGANPQAELGVPESLIHHAEKMGLPARRLFGLDEGWTYQRAGFTVRAVPAAHESVDRDQVGRLLYLGFIIEADDRRLYHSGDTVVYDGLIESLGPEPFDVLFLPINGRDPARGVPGNMTAAEAVELASVVRPRFVVPHHFDMFTFNTVAASVFEAEARRLPPGVSARVLACGARWEIHP
ncbi:MAG: MBL fold metallo-hydrolase [Isosphaeraceae bacterium]|nr:MAG: MBL fold metallo-hydrolase [Isosphaeraceae bacterium]